MTAPAAQPASAPDAFGRRRAQLLRGDAQPVRSTPAAVQATPPVQPLSIADVHELRNNPSAGARTVLAAKFGRQYDSLVQGETRSLAESVLHLLVKDLEKSVRQTLAETLAASPNLPHEVAARLAHDDIEVARPVLEHSPVLSDKDLAEIVRTHAMQYALAVAGRQHLSEYSPRKPPPSASVCAPCVPVMSRNAPDLVAVSRRSRARRPRTWRARPRP